ncbi:ribonuclease P protein component [Dysgonomonas sp. 511]|uniref:ribonuclease P protein component n=1 Tax=Dysgonomonas sp. 511 TaxID=2302930 RepID=UPI0013D2767B|nr:ribonuclease P protein component [Dysgonomonas sp. 511]NDV78518.1 ribonuclease P protein component [Dysgonomonas sp. 511]
MDKTILATRNTFEKRERLCSKKSNDRLFASGKSFISYPLRIVYFMHDGEGNTQSSRASVLISVSKKKFKRAVKRNRVKRLIRESYRLNKHDFVYKLDSCNKYIDIAFLYLKNELPEFAEVQKAMQKALMILDGKVTEDVDEKNTL